MLKVVIFGFGLLFLFAVIHLATKTNVPASPHLAGGSSPLPKPSLTPLLKDITGLATLYASMFNRVQAVHESLTTMGDAIAAATAQTDIAVIETSMGDITFALFTEEAPGTVRNFQRLAESGFYDGQCFYRIECPFVLQGGGGRFADGSGKTTPFGTIKLEYRVPNYERMVSMARYDDPDSAHVDFSIQLSDNSQWLGPGGSNKDGYAVFAEVVDGWNVVQSICKNKEKFDKESGGRVEIRTIEIGKAPANKYPRIPKTW